MAKAPVCPYCNRASIKVTGEAIYPHRKDLLSKIFYLCRPCRSYVGCHPGTDKPLGIPANSDLRGARHKAHAAFDPKWRNRVWGTRRQAYSHLAQKLGLTVDECHIGGFDQDMCEKVIEACS
jgi:hypothetical protein